ncbi:MAG: phenylalanine--tRNA ligase subunit beta [Flavobacteriaceae bacterium]
MKISYNWIKEFLKIDLAAEHVSELLTDLGLEVEGTTVFESIPGGLQGVVVGEVMSCEQHPNADRLRCTTVDLGNDTIVPIVCGAPNVAKGQKVAVATVGTTLYDADQKTFEIRKSKIRGELSVGMICAEDELGLGDSHEGIMVLASSLTNGTPLAEVFEVTNDTVFEIGLTPNRADAMSHMGVARDLKSICMLNDIPFEWNYPSVSDFSVESTQIAKNIQVLNPDKAPQYFGICLTDISIQPSPDWLQNHLKAIGIQPKNNVVDITNYVLHELGQPLHAFDLSKLKGDVVVKAMEEGTRFTTLDGVERRLSAEDLMICDEHQAHCLAGVFGGQDSGVSEQTTSIFLESAYFDPVSIRKSAKRHGLHTDASFRFERGIDPELCAFALKRAALLIQQLAGGKISSALEEVVHSKPEPIALFIKFDEIKSLLGQAIPRETLTTIFNALEMEIESVSEEGVALKIPTYRVDVTRPADVIEDILRVYGYNKIEASTGAYHISPAYDWKSPYRVQELMAQNLTGLGYTEMMNNSITNPAYGELIHADEEKAVNILNPLGTSLSQMRSSLLFSALETVSFNLKNQSKNLRFFEFGKTYQQSSEKYIEKQELALIQCGLPYTEHWQSSGLSETAFHLKGSVEQLLATLGLELQTQSISTEDPVFSDGVSFLWQKKTIARLGTLNATIAQKFDIDTAVYYAELDMDLIFKAAFKQPIKVHEINKYPGMRRDFALLIDQGLAFEDLKDIAHKVDRKILREVSLFDVYEGKNLPQGKKSYGLSFYFQDPHKTLTDKAVDKVMQKLQKQFETQLGAQLR